MDMNDLLIVFSNSVTSTKLLKNKRIKRANISQHNTDKNNPQY